eukprot:2527014-Amphidinium_carterae.1
MNIVNNIMNVSPVSLTFPKIITYTTRSVQVLHEDLTLIYVSLFPTDIDCVGRKHKRGLWMPEVTRSNAGGESPRRVTPYTNKELPASISEIP